MLINTFLSDDEIEIFWLKGKLIYIRRYTRLFRLSNATDP